MTRLCEMCPKNTAGAASLYCEADASYLCTTCDEVVHGANRLASRHVRRPIELSDVSSTSLPTLDDCSMGNLNIFFDDSHHYRSGKDYDLADLAAMPPLPLDSLFGGPRTTPSLEWDTVLGSLPESVRRVKSEPNLSGACQIEPPSPISSVTEGSVLSSPPSTQTPTNMTSSTFNAALSSSSSSPLPSAPQPPGSSTLSGDMPTLEQRKQLRAKALARFRSKRASRSFAKRVRYECRKQLADSRPRVKGRFVKKSEMALYRKYGELYRNYMHEITGETRTSAKSTTPS